MPQIAQINKNFSWVCSGTSDTLTCNIMPPRGGKGVQVAVVGASLENNTVTVFDRSGASKIAEVPASTGAILILGDSATDIGKVVLSNFAAGTYTGCISAK